jgi:DNA-binding response OmpR family regulator
MSEPLHILILEDRATDAELVLREVRKEGIEFAALRVETEDDFRRQLREFRPGLILSDYSLPAYDGLSALEVARVEWDWGARSKRPCFPSPLHSFRTVGFPQYGWK